MRCARPVQRVQELGGLLRYRNGEAGFVSVRSSLLFHLFCNLQNI